MDIPDNLSHELVSVGLPGTYRNLIGCVFCFSLEESPSFKHAVRIESVEWAECYLALMFQEHCRIQKINCYQADGTVLWKACVRGMQPCNFPKVNIHKA